MLQLAILAIVFLGLSGLMAAVDAAVLSVTRPEIEELVQKRKWGSIRLRQVKQQLAFSLVVIVVLTNVINVAGPILVSRYAFQLFAGRGVIIVTVVLMLGTIVFSEILPKAIGAHHAPVIARLSSPAILFVRKLLYPIVVVLAWLSGRFTKGTRKIGTERQIRSLVRIGLQSGHIEHDEEKMIHRAFILNDRTAEDIMTPIAEVKAIAASSSIDEASAEICRSEFSRYPVFGRSIDEVCGVVMSRDVLKSAASDRVDDAVSSLARSPLIVDASDRSDDLLTLFRDRHNHFAIVRRDAKTIGVVTLEDVLEQLVGEIEDEKDVA